MKRSILFSLLLLMWTCLFGLTLKVQAAGELPRMEQSECPIEVPEEHTIECGYLVTFEDYEDPTSREIRTPFLVVRSDPAAPTDEALLFTEGGPGYSSLRFVQWIANTEFASKRDIIILEQRGNRYSQPSLTCDFGMWWEEEGDTLCLESLRQQGIDPKYYTTSSIAADIRALMQVLDYKQWNLLGTSYSTRVMQKLLREDLQGIRSVVLHSISPLADARYLHDPEHSQRVIEKLFADCQADTACAAAYPDLEKKFYSLVKELNRQPVIFETTFPGSSSTTNLVVNGDTLIGWMVGSAFYGPAFPPFQTAYLPLLIDRVADGETDLLYPWAKEGLIRWEDEDFSWGLYFSVVCQDEAPMVPPDRISNQIAEYPQMDGYFRHEMEIAICAAWDLPPELHPLEEPVTSSVPVLALGGSYDPITPPEWSRQALTNMGSSTFVEFPALGHSVLSNSACAEHIVAQFLDNPEATLDLSCLEAEPEPQFVLPGEILIAPAVYEIHYGELGYSILEENLFLGSWLSVIAGGVISLFAALVILVRSGRRTQLHQPSNRLIRTSTILLIGLAATVLVWGYAFRFNLQFTANTIPNLLRFGLPASAWWLFAIAILIGMMSFALTGITAAAWWFRLWSLPRRIFYTLVSLAAAIFCGMLANWDLFTVLFW